MNCVSTAVFNRRGARGFSNFFVDIKHNLADGFLHLDLSAFFSFAFALSLVVGA